MPSVRTEWGSTLTNQSRTTFHCSKYFYSKTFRGSKAGALDQKCRNPAGNICHPSQNVSGEKLLNLTEKNGPFFGNETVMADFQLVAIYVYIHFILFSQKDALWHLPWKLWAVLMGLVKQSHFHIFSCSKLLLYSNRIS